MNNPDEPAVPSPKDGQELSEKDLDQVAGGVVPVLMAAAAVTVGVAAAVVVSNTLGTAADAVSDALEGNEGGKKNKK